MIKHFLTWLFVVALLCCVKLNSAVATEDIKGKQETVIQHRTIEQPQPKRTYTEQEIAEINAAKEVVKKYWLSSYDAIYNLFSSKYQQRLRNTRNILNASDYKKSMPLSERVWLSQTYQEGTIQDHGLVQIVVLAAWEEEGYHGVMTFIFDMMKEDGRWKITNIMF